MVTLGFSSPTQAEQHSLSNSAKLILLTLSGIYKCKYEDDNYNEKARCIQTYGWKQSSLILTPTESVLRLRSTVLSKL